MTNRRGGVPGAIADDDIAGYAPGDEYDDDDTAAEEIVPEVVATAGPALPFTA